MIGDSKALSYGEFIAETRGLKKVFRDFLWRPKVTAVRGLDLGVRRGELFGLLGPNGSGKSTTIKLLLALLRPTEGVVRVLDGSPRDPRNKARIGYLPEESQFYSHLTAEETLRFYGALFGLAGPELRSRADGLLERLGLASARKRRVGEFSKGMLRRIGIAQALINDPDLLVLDEPTAGLDPVGTRQVKELLLELKRRGKTVILSSHLLSHVEDVCDRVAILHEGSLQALGAIDDLLADDQRTQIITGRLSPATIEGLAAWLKSREGIDLSVSVGRPSTRLEEFFIRTLGEARRP